MVTELKDSLRALGITHKELSRLLNVSESTITRAFKKPHKYKHLIDQMQILIASKGDSGTDEATLTRKGLNTLEAKRIISTNPANLSLEQIVELFELDANKWQCAEFSTKSWNTTMKDKNSEPMVSRNYSVHAKFKPAEGYNPTKEDISWVFEEAVKQSNYFKNVKYETAKSPDNLLVLPILDAHIGKLAWGKETGENYDIKIAVDRYRKIVKGIVERAKDVGFCKIIFPVGNDFFQHDGDSETTKGTKVDTDIRWKKMFQVGVNLLKDTLDYLSQYAEVDVILTQGNHDNHMSFYAFETLRGWYHKHPRVTIDEDIRTRTYRAWGVNLLGFTHGDKEGDNLYKLMQQEARELWGKTKYSEWIIGHYHRSYVDERHGVVKRVVNSISGTDAWHYEKGFIGTLRASQGIIYHRNQLGPHTIIQESISYEEI